MNGRSYPTSATAVDRGASGPVLAWNVDPTHFPAGTYPEMPAAAAAAVSPVVPSASAAPPDPYGRCWQNQVDPSACFPYFGTLYGSSLPPPSYRMQPGCLSNLGQFWPPTPPPEGCVRYDGASNLHYCSPLTPVFRHGESLPQNMLRVPQRLSHYSHLIDINKDSSVKRIDPCLDSIQRQKLLLNSKHSKEAQQQQQQPRTCSCYECHDKSFSGTPLSLNKENIGGSKTLDQKFPDDKLKLKSCKKAKESRYSQPRSIATYHQNGSAINSYPCSMEQNIVRSMSSLQVPNHTEFLAQNSNKLDALIPTSNCVQHDFLRPESNSFPISRCSSNSLSIPSKDVPQAVPVMTKNPELSMYENGPDKASLHNKLHTSTSGFDSCLPMQPPCSSNSMQRSTEKSCCFSPPYMSSRTMHSSYPETSTPNKPSNMLLMYNGNGYNASPLKNVYFSYYESENFDMGSGIASRKNKSSFCKVPKSLNNVTAVTPSNSQHNLCNQQMFSSANGFSSTSNNPRVSHYDGPVVSNDPYGCIYQSSCIQQKSSSDYPISSSTKKSDSSQLLAKQKITSVCIKQEKSETMDCKFQKSQPNNKVPQLPHALNGVLNLSTSLRCPKLEPDDQVITSVASARTYSNAPVSHSETSICNPPIMTDCNLKQSCSNTAYYSSMSASSHLLKCCEVPDAMTPQMHELESDCTPAVPEDLCPIVQAAPLGGAELAVLNKMPPTGHEAPTEVSCLNSEGGCEVITTKKEEHIGQSSLELHSLAGPDRLHDQECFLPFTAEEMSATSNFKAGYPETMPQLSAECSVVMNLGYPNSDACESGNSINEKTQLAFLQDEDTEEIIMPSVKLEKDDEDDVIEPETKEQISDTGEKVSDVVVKEELDSLKEPENKSPDDNNNNTIPDYSGLYLLLQGIDHKTNNNILKTEQSVNSELSTNTPVKTIQEEDSSASTMKGLNLLCALAEEHFITEFGKDQTCKVETTEAEDTASNFPTVKEEMTEDVLPTVLESNEDDIKKETAEINAEDSMRKRLAELQQKYKEKQKELARLQPKKTRMPYSSTVSASSNDTSCASTNSCQSVNCSEVVKEFPELVCSIDLKRNDISVTDRISKQTKSHKSSKSNSTTVADESSQNSSVVKMNDAISKSTSKRQSRASIAVQLSGVKRKLDLNESTNDLVEASSKCNTKGKISDSSKTSTPISEFDTSECPKTKRRKKLFKHKNSRSTDKEVKKSFENVKSEQFEPLTVQDMRSPKKRKAENPKRFIPSKQIRLTETIIAKQLRNRILLESPNRTSKSENKCYDVPEELFDALRKCHLGEDKLSQEKSEPKSPTCDKSASTPQNISQAMKDLRMTLEHLQENKRILAIEEGLFYAGSIKEVQSTDLYSIVLDGQRGNKKHLFSQEEMLSQTMLEVKPVSLDELPEGTRVCAFWSHQYRCLYPGTVVRAPAPSPDWSEPRVYVEFDDGDSAQIAVKNIRFLPSDIQLVQDDESKEYPAGVPLAKNHSSQLKKCISSQKKQRKIERESKKQAKISKTEFLIGKSNSCSNNSNAEECHVQTEETQSPSHTLVEERLAVENKSTDEVMLVNEKMLKRTQKQFSKKRSGSKNKTKDDGAQVEKSKKHKKYKDRHKHHHHHRHHHRHHRHCHHRHHCKKRKHHKHASNVDNIINVVIPSSSIPLGNLITKSTRSSMRNAESQYISQSKRDVQQLPQSGCEPDDSRKLHLNDADEKSPGKNDCIPPVAR